MDNQLLKKDSAAYFRYSRHYHSDRCFAVTRHVTDISKQNLQSVFIHYVGLQFYRYFSFTTVLFYLMENISAYSIRSTVGYNLKIFVVILALPYLEYFMHFRTCNV
jgi:hypothetical protein